MAAIDKIYFERYSIDPDIDSILPDVLLDGWVENIDNEDIKTIELDDDDWY